MNKTNKIITLASVLFLCQGLSGCASTKVNPPQFNSTHQEIEEILKSAGLTVNSVEEAVFKAENAMQSGKMDLAQLYYVKAYNLAPKNIQILQKMADLYSKIKKYDLVELSLKLILEQKPDDIATIERYGMLLLKRGNYSEAEKNLRLVISQQPNWRAYNALGIIANLQGNVHQAESYFKMADRHSPNSPELLNNIGFALYSAKNLNQAALFYHKALEINPNYKKAIYNLGLLHAHLKNYEEAYVAFAKVASTAEANNNTGYIAMMNGDYDVANRYLQEAIRISPQYYKKANDNLKQLQLVEADK